LLSAALLILAAVSAHAKDFGPISASGYVKDILELDHSQLDGRPWTLNTTRERLTLDGGWRGFKGHVDYDHEDLAGNFFRTRDYAAFGLGEPATWLDMEQTISTTATSIDRHRLYRGYLGYESESATLRFGRQRVAWGTGKFWNPTDVLNPYQPTTVERDERRGVDAAYGKYALGELSQAELAWAPQDRWTGHALLGRVKSNWRGYDASIMGGKIGTSTSAWMAGGDFAGNLFDGTAHGEWSYVDTKTRTPTWQADVGYDYTFPAENKIWILRDASLVAEYFHSGAGQLDRTKYDVAGLLGGARVTLAQDYFGASYSKDVHPLVKLELSAIQNADDGSDFFSPSLQYNVVTNLYLTAGWQRFGGAKSTELGRAPNMTFFMGQYYF